jgi:hypothetical protein
MGSHWERAILFEGIALPGTAIAIDHLGMYDNLPEMSEATALWLWDFTICVGRKRTDSSDNILRHVRETRDLLAKFRERLLVSVPQHYDSSFSSATLDSWMTALQTVEAIAKSRSQCSWEAAVRKGDLGFTELTEQPDKEA